VSQLQRESNLNDIFVKRFSNGVKEVKRIIEIEKSSNEEGNDMIAGWHDRGFLKKPDLKASIEALQVNFEVHVGADLSACLGAIQVCPVVACWTRYRQARPWSDL